jgi:hypothetical protein
MWINRIVKITIGALTFIIILTSITFLFKNSFLAVLGKTDESCILISPYKNVKYKVYGKVFEPNMPLPIATPSGFKSIEFLVDSGAVVSTIPKGISRKVFDGELENLERTVLRGFGGSSTFGYVGVMKAKFGDKIINIPVVFSESNSTRPILGRKGFLEDVTTIFNDNGEYLCIKN